MKGMKNHGTGRPAHCSRCDYIIKGLSTQDRTAKNIYLCKKCRKKLKKMEKRNEKVTSGKDIP